MSIKIITRFRCKEDLDCFMGKFTNDSVPRETKEITFNKEGIVHLKLGKPKKDEQKITPKVMKYLQHWKDMPEFKVRFHKSDYAKIDIFFEDYTIEELKELYEQTVTEKTKSLWFPRLVHGQNNNIRVIGGRKAKHPIYVVSKNRSDIGKMHVSYWLTNMQQPHYIILEKEDIPKYQETYGKSPYCTLIELPQEFKDNYDVFDETIGQQGTTGPGAARNFAMEHAKVNGNQWCWCLDDNCEFPGFVRYYRGRRIPCYSAECFRTLEDFVDRFSNVGQAGLNYSKFCIDEQMYPPYTTNTRIYSFLLLRTDLPYRWRGRYNEDTCLSLDMLKDGWCTIQLNCYTAAKVTTQKVKGGNSEEFYTKDEGGTLPKSEMLAKMHPDVAKVVWKFNRWHHEVDYSGFTQELQYKPEYEYLKNEPFTFEENGVRIVRIPKEDVRTERDTLEYILEHYDKPEYYLDEGIFL